MKQATLTDAQFVDGDEAVPTVEQVTPEVAAPSPAADPFRKVEAGVLELPSHPEWECSGPVHQPAVDEHSITWRGSHAVPGYPWSEKAIVAVETTGATAAYTLAVYPFDGDGDHRGVPQPRLDVGEYDRLRTALRNVEAALEKLPAVEDDEGVVLGDAVYEG